MLESREREEEDCETKARVHYDPANDPAGRSCENPSKNTWRERRFQQDHRQDRPRRIVVVILGVISEILRGDCRETYFMALRERAGTDRLSPPIPAKLTKRETKRLMLMLNSSNGQNGNGPA
jgi:hypothetical protein